MLLDPGRPSPTTRPDWNRSRTSEAGLSHPQGPREEGNRECVDLPSAADASLRRHPLDAPAMRIERAPSEGYAHRAKRIDLLTAPAMRIEWAPSKSYAHTAERLYAHKTNPEPPGLCA